MTKFRLSILTLITLFISSSVFISCSSDESVSDGFIKQGDVLNRINSDISSTKYYPDAENKYNYSAVNMKNFIESKNINFKFSNTKIDNESAFLNYKENLIEHYTSIGYTTMEIQDLFNDIDNINYENTEEMFNGMLSNETEKEILNAYVSIFENNTIDATEFSNITSIFENAISNSNFSEKEKRDMLTIFDVAKFMKTNDFIQIIEQNGTINIYGKDLETVCAGNMLVSMGAGAILGNGVGVVVGMFTGAWMSWKDGCFD